MGKALIVKLGAIGDVIMAIPSAWVLHQRGLEVNWVCGSAVAPLLACYPWVRTIVIDDRSLLTGSILTKLKILALLWRRLGGQQYELCATLYYDNRYRLVTLPVRARRKITLSKSARTEKILPSRSHADEYARILLGLDDDCRPLTIGVARPELLPENPLAVKTAATRIAMVPGGASNILRQQTLRRWPAENYAELGRRLLKRGWEVVLLGGPDDVWVRSYFEGMEVVDKIGAFTLPQVISACNGCDAVITHDTGPLHLAGLSRAAVVALFGPTDPGNFLPRRPGVVGIWGGEGFACRPCYDGRDFAPCTNNGCMQQISVEMVMRQLERLLDKPTAPVQVVMPSVAGYGDR